MTVIEAARRAQGLSLTEAAKRTRLSARYLRRIELHGCDSYGTAQKLAWLYQAPLDAFLNPRADQSARGDARRQGSGTPAASGLAGEGWRAAGEPVESSGDAASLAARRG
jgi:transcriptional regulator with XRE-family HTH domain